MRNDPEGSWQAHDHTQSAPSLPGRSIVRYAHYRASALVVPACRSRSFSSDAPASAIRRSSPSGTAPKRTAIYLAFALKHARRDGGADLALTRLPPFVDPGHRSHPLLGPARRAGGEPDRHPYLAAAPARRALRADLRLPGAVRIALQPPAAPEAGHQ